MTRRRTTRGFTLIELMITVTIVGVLLALAGVAYKKYLARGRAAEVMGMFAEIRTKEEAYRAENSTYVSISSSETSVYPALVPGSEPLAKTITMPAAWSSLGLQPQRNQLYCGYAAIAGGAGGWTGKMPDGTATTAGSKGQAHFVNVPTAPWFYMYATCDNDNNSAVNAEFLSSSITTALIDTNPTR